ncbi:MAG: 50S ribosomal protein L18 [Gammaproteobacteria bacterium]|nr:50S ribosomal protein L18 [Gammaproteobacteria bacterium]
MADKQKRLRRLRKTRAKMRELEMVRLVVHRTSQHIYAQLINESDVVLAAVSTIQSDVKASIKNGSNIEAAKIVGSKIAELAKSAGVSKVAFDRSGFKYHGRVKALADAAREGGMEF